jgi:catechol 2,3-dioxygenase-like lactoylglutathione lyase family enzyme
MIMGFVHVGMSVSNLDRSVAFYREQLGMQLVAQDTFSGPQYAQILALPGAKGKVALLKVGSFELELFEFAAPKPIAKATVGAVSDLGISHFCLEVDDLDAAYRRLAAEGVAFHCEPIHFAGAGKATYCRDPDGNVFELVEVDKEAGIKP